MNKQNQLLLLLLGFLSLIASQSNIPIISRNKRVNDIRDVISSYEENFDALRYNDCGGEPQYDCSNLEVWRSLRSKHSKNITNLQDKLASYNRTIQDILIANKQQITAVNNSMMKLFPEFTKLKNDEEQINILIMVANETYVKSDINSMYATIFASVSSLQSGNKTVDANDPPLIDEDYFEEENETNYTYNPEPSANQTEEDQNELFGLEKPEENKKKEPEIVADDIPEGKNVKEHDSDHIQELNKPVPDDYNAAKPVIENLNIFQLQEELKEEVKDQGRYVLSMLSQFKEKLMKEQQRLRQEICDYEREMTKIHKKHMQQIIQIFSEGRKIQKLIFEKDDAVLQLDMKIKFCEGANLDQINFDNCLAQNNKNLAQIDNIEELIKGTVKELDKLSQYEDKNIYDPNFVQYSTIKITPFSNNMEYIDYSSDGEGKLISRKTECVVTECRERIVKSEQNFQLILKKKYQEMTEEELLNDGEVNSELQNGNKVEDWRQGLNLMDENFGDFGDATNEQQQERQKITDEEIESSLKILQGEIQEDFSEPIVSIKNKLSDDILENNEQIKNSNNLIMNANPKNSKKKSNETKNQDLEQKDPTQKNEKKSKKSKQQPKEEKKEDQKDKNEGLFSRFYNYFFGKQQTQTFLLQLQ